MRKTVVTMATVTVVGLGSVFFSTPTSAESIEELENQQTQIKEDREEIKANLSNAEAEIADLLLDLEELNDEIDRVNDALEQNKATMEENEQSIETTQEEVDKLEEEIKELEEQIELRFDILKDRAASYQKNGGNISYLEVLFGSQDFMDFISRVGAINKITESDAKLMEEIDADKVQVEEMQDEVAAKLDELKESKADLELMQELIEDQQEANQDKKAELKEKEETLVAKADELEIEDSELASLEQDVLQNIDELRQPAREVQVASASTDENTESNTESNSEASSESNSNANSNESSNDSSVNNDTSNNNSGNLTTTSSSEKKSTSTSPKKPKNNGGGSGAAQSAINAGYTQTGTPYVWAGKGPGGFDCSGFVSWAYGQAGVSIPSHTKALLGAGSKVSSSDMQPGDLVFFSNNNHVGIYVGGGNFIGAQTSTGVKVESLTSGYWAGEFNGEVRRVN